MNKQLRFILSLLLCLLLCLPLVSTAFATQDAPLPDETTTAASDSFLPDPTAPASDIPAPEPPQETAPGLPLVIRLSENNKTLGVGETLQLYVTDDDGSPADAAFDCDRPQTLSMVSPGQFLALSPGQAVVSATNEAGANDLCFVTVLPAPSSLKLNASAQMVGVGETVSFSAVPNAGTHTSTLRYESNSAALHKEQDATFRAVAAGTATVTVKAHNGVSSSRGVTVLKAPKKVVLSETALTLGVGETAKLKVSFPDGSFSSRLTYASSGKAVSVSGGTVRALKKGSATVTVTTHNGKQAQCTVTVLKAPKSVTLSSSVLQLNPGDTHTFSYATKTGYAANKVTYRSSNNKVLQHTGKAADGTFFAKKKGSATVTLTTYNGVSAQCEVQVLKLPKKIRFEQTSYSAVIGKKIRPLLVLPENTCCTNYTFSSSDAYVAAVDDDGTIRPKSVGTATITAQTPNGKTARCTVTVGSMPVPFVSQLPDYPTGCEAASCTALLRYYGYDITLDQMVRTIPRQNIVVLGGRRYGPDINEKFVGNPAKNYTDAQPGYGAFSPVIEQALQKAVDARGGSHTAKRISGCSFKTLLKHVSKGRPAVVWATYQMMTPKYVNSWYITQPDGSVRYFEYPRGTHVFVLKGYSRKTVTLMDPYFGTRTYNINTFQARWNLLGKQAVVLT